MNAFLAKLNLLNQLEHDLFVFQLCYIVPKNLRYLSIHQNCEFLNHLFYFLFFFRAKIPGKLLKINVLV